MGKRVISVSADNTFGYLELACLLKFNQLDSETDEFETPYNYGVLITKEVKSNDIKCIEIQDAEELLKVIDKKDCLPDVGLLDYEDNELNLNLKDVTLKELLKEILNKILK